jgi:hypothetical protein
MVRVIAAIACAVAGMFLGAMTGVGGHGYTEMAAIVTMSAGM